MPPDFGTPALIIAKGIGKGQGTNMFAIKMLLRLQLGSIFFRPKKNSPEKLKRIAKNTRRAEKQ
jgi:hypothetical protein